MRAVGDGGVALSVDELDGAEVSVGRRKGLLPDGDGGGSDSATGAVCRKTRSRVRCFEDGAWASRRSSARSVPALDWDRSGGVRKKDRI